MVSKQSLQAACTVLLLSTFAMVTYYAPIGQGWVRAWWVHRYKEEVRKLQRLAYKNELRESDRTGLPRTKLF